MMKRYYNQFNLYLVVLGFTVKYCKVEFLVLFLLKTEVLNVSMSQSLYMYYNNKSMLIDIIIYM
jgi:hypothetical protein